MTKRSLKLQDAHMAEAARVNLRRSERQKYHVVDCVWVLRPMLGTSDQKVESWWVGPVPVVSRTGDASYEVELISGILHMVYADRLKPYFGTT
jgi:hypothetical protein